jgi:hypothetical protein
MTPIAIPSEENAKQLAALREGLDKGTPKGNEENPRVLLAQLRESLGLPPELPKPRSSGALGFRMLDAGHGMLERHIHARISRAYYSIYEWLRPADIEARNIKPPFKGNPAANPALIFIILNAWSRT